MTRVMSSNPTEDDSAVRTAAQFATTHWSVVLAAGDSGSPASREALERLCRQYWYPLYVFARRVGRDAEEARDLTQAFFERLIAQRFVKTAIRERGRFRNFLLTAFKRFLINEREHDTALKRGGGFVFVPLDASWMEAVYLEDTRRSGQPEFLFDRAWARTVMREGLRRLEAELGQAGKSATYDALSPFLSSPAGAGDYEKVGERLGLSAHAVASAVQRLRTRFRALVREEIAHTVPTPADVDAELRYMVELLTQ